MTDIKEITIDEVMEFKDDTGLVLQGCGGDLQEWVDGINKMLSDKGILVNGHKLNRVYTFKAFGLTNLLFMWVDEDCYIGKLAMWRLNYRQQFGAMWLSDYIDNYFKIEEEDDGIPY